MDKDAGEDKDYVNDKEQKNNEPNKSKKRKLPEGYGVDRHLLKAMRVMITALDEELGKDFEQDGGSEGE